MTSAKTTTQKLQKTRQQRKAMMVVKKIATVLFFVFIFIALLLAKNYSETDRSADVCFAISIAELIILAAAKIVDAFLLEKIKRFKQTLRIQKFVRND